MKNTAIDLWGKTFSPAQDVRTPAEIIKTQCDLLEKATEGSVVAKIKSYVGTPSFDLLIKLDKPVGEGLGIQADLGNVTKEAFTFEFFITSTSTPNYKYRVMFLHYEIPCYPVHIVLDESIAKELEIIEDFACNSQESFEDALSTILRSTRVENIINSLLAVALEGCAIDTYIQSGD